MKVYSYLRVSGKGQIVGNGFDRQLETIQADCAKADYEIERIFREQVSGTKDETDRPEFKAMISAIMRDSVDTVIVESLDRLAREYRIQEQLLIYLASKGINLISANTGENVTQAITEDPMKKAMVQMQGIFAELDKSLTVKKLRKAREKIRQQTGKCEGRKSYRETEEGTKILREIRRLRRKRKGRVRRKFNEIAEALNNQGYRAANGKLFTGNTVRGIFHRSKKLR
ncbi:MAG: recombinase family protein [Desulfobacterales bacterium]|nr:MAG: recombinase family protein [Desulfobacterales bacterium]